MLHYKAAKRAHRAHDQLATDIAGQRHRGDGSMSMAKAARGHHTLCLGKELVAGVLMMQSTPAQRGHSLSRRVDYRLQAPTVPPEGSSSAAAPPGRYGAYTAHTEFLAIRAHSAIGAEQ